MLRPANIRRAALTRKAISEQAKTALSLDYIEYVE